MAQIIKPLYDGAGNEIIPQTKAEAVDVGSGENLSGRLTSVNAQLAEKANKAQEAWITPTLLNGATELTASPPRYIKDQFNFVRMKGRVVSPNTNSFSPMRLPSGYRPTENREFIVGNGGSLARVTVASDGFLTVYNPSTLWFSLDGISFSTL